MISAEKYNKDLENRKVTANEQGEISKSIKEQVAVTRCATSCMPVDNIMWPSHLTLSVGSTKTNSDIKGLQREVRIHQVSLRLGDLSSPNSESIKATSSDGVIQVYGTAFAQGDL